MSGTVNSDIFDRIALVEAKFNFEIDRVKPGSFKDSEVALNRAFEAVNILKRLEEIKELRQRRQGLGSSARLAADERKLYEK